MSKYNIYNVIDLLLLEIQDTGYSKSKLLFDYIKFMRYEKLGIELEHLQYIGKLLEYKAGWAMFKYKELL